MDNRLNVSVRLDKRGETDERLDALYEKMLSHFRVTNMDIKELVNVGGYDFLSYNFKVISRMQQVLKVGLNYTPMTPIHTWSPMYYFTRDPPLVWKYSGSLVEIDIQSVSSFLLLMFASAATVYWSTRCLRRWCPTTTGFLTILWDFFASFFYEPFPSDSGVLSIRLVLASWLMGITIFCNEVNGVFKGKLSMKENAGVETEEDLDAFGYKFKLESTYSKIYESVKYGKRTEMKLAGFDNAYREKNIYTSKRSAAQLFSTLAVWLATTKSSPFEYDPRIHETIMNWDLRLYEGTTGRTDEKEEFYYRLRKRFNKDPPLFTAYQMTDLSVPFQLYGYGLAAAISAKFLETILAIYDNRKPNRKSKHPKPIP